MDENENPIRYVFVVGFHHKKGCQVIKKEPKNKLSCHFFSAVELMFQVEYCYPPLVSNITRITDDNLPPQWRHISSLALPDGAHNYEKGRNFLKLQISTKKILF